MTINFKEEIQKDMAESGFNVHDNLKDLSVPELRAICDSERRDFYVCAISVTGDMNIGSIIRTACLFGAQKVFVLGRRKFDRRGLVGSINYIDVEFPGGLNDNLTIDDECFIKCMKDNNAVPVFVEQGGEDLGTFSWLDKRSKMGMYGSPCLVVGNENRGIPDNILRTQSEFQGSFRVSIPQRGVIRSHNVSVAAGIVMSNLSMEL